MDFFQITFLGVLQGLTEFLPISSSGHLILPSLLFSWNDQGLTFDVAVHVGTLVAVLLYFRKDILRLTLAWLKSFAVRQNTEDSRLAWMLIVATIPAGIAGLLLNDYVEEYGRSLLVIGVTSIVFALFLYWSDKTGSKQLSMAELNWKTVLLIGFAQVLAIIPGTSRSGVTMTAALFCNLDRRAAARFSFLMSIPLILGSGLLKGLDLAAEGGAAVEWLVLAYGALVSAVVAYFCIHFFLQLIERVGFVPFVIYRLIMGFLLLTLAF
ncbi:MAG: undecaprenyl-diphosphatase [SAR86 cluster bacterium]|uniref:Undecaprenyl-diphosphatase n=1 Tax=SAR86 cluster bacterium TaxID=2030880 RepID=A0A2A5B0H3_9GAMM|nr:MAG: undecaprenyl-diphosphatase [SAR86 cluster bacterium]